MARLVLASSQNAHMHCLFFLLFPVCLLCCSSTTFFCTRYCCADQKQPFHRAYLLGPCHVTIGVCAWKHCLGLEIIPSKVQKALSTGWTVLSVCYRHLQYKNQCIFQLPCTSSIQTSPGNQVQHFCTLHRGKAKGKSKWTFTKKNADGLKASCLRVDMGCATLLLFYVVVVAYCFVFIFFSVNRPVRHFKSHCQGLVCFLCPLFWNILCRGSSWTM